MRRRGIVTYIVGHSMPSGKEEPLGLEVVFESLLHDLRHRSEARPCVRRPVRGVVLIA